MRSQTKYILVQLPSALLLAAILLLLQGWLDFPAWAGAGILALWVIKDILLYPLVRRAYEPAGDEFHLQGEVGVARERLAPVGYIEIRGELWRAEVAGGKAVEAGEKVKVRAIEGLTLRVEVELPEL